jgi:peptidoglycan hydrolase CwlO-like protein
MRKLILAGIVGVLALCTAPIMAAPQAPHSAGKLQAQVKAVDAKLAAAHSKNDALQAQVAAMEKRNAAKQEQLQQRDDEIAALQKKLQAAGAPASAATTAGH